MLMAGGKKPVMKNIRKGWFSLISDFIVVFHSAEIFNSNFYISINVNFGGSGFFLYKYFTL